MWRCFWERRGQPAIFGNLRSKLNLEKILPHTIYKKMQPNALLIWQQKYL
jgi:hypothetical protein